MNMLMSCDVISTRTCARDDGVWVSTFSEYLMVHKDNWTAQPICMHVSHMKTCRFDMI